TAFTSSVRGRADADVSVLATQGSILFDKNLAVQAVEGSVLATASGASNRIDINGNAALYANAYGDNAGGPITVSGTSGGTVDVDGNLTLQAQGAGVYGQTSTGGTILV